MHRFKNILVAMNAEGAPDALLSRARWLAQQNGARLTLVDVLDSNPGELQRLLSALPGARAKEVETQVWTHLHARLEGLAAPLRAAGLMVDVDLRQGVAFIELIRQVMSGKHDLLMKAAEDAPLRQILGGLDLHLVRKCPCPVWVLNSPAEPRAGRIVAAVDTDPDDPVRDTLNRKIMDLATSLARRDGAKLDVVNAWGLPEESTLRSALVKAPEDAISLLLDKARTESAGRLHRLTEDYTEFSDLMHIMHVKGSAADVISRHATDERVDTLVMGTLGRTGLPGMLIGNTADTVLNRVSCSVLAVKPEGFISPVKMPEPDT